MEMNEIEWMWLAMWMWLAPVASDSQRTVLYGNVKWSGSTPLHFTPLHSTPLHGGNDTWYAH